MEKKHLIKCKFTYKGHRPGNIFRHMNLSRGSFIFCYLFKRVCYYFLYKLYWLLLVVCQAARLTTWFSKKHCRILIEEMKSKSLLRKTKVRKAFRILMLKTYHVSLSKISLRGFQNRSDQASSSGMLCMVLHHLGDTFNINTIVTAMIRCYAYSYWENSEFKELGVAIWVWTNSNKCFHTFIWSIYILCIYQKQKCWYISIYLCVTFARVLKQSTNYHSRSTAWYYIRFINLCKIHCTMHYKNHLIF